MRSMWVEEKEWVMDLAIIIITALFAVFFLLADDIVKSTACAFVCGMYASVYVKKLLQKCGLGDMLP